MKAAVACLALAALGYLVASVGIQRKTFIQKRSDLAGWRRLLWVSLAVHTLGLGLYSFVAGHLPLTHISETIAPLGWVIMVLYLIFGERWRVEVVGTVAAPAAFATTVFSAFTLWSEGPQGSSDIWKILHVTSIVLGYATFILAAACALLYFVQARLLKQKKLGGLLKVLPALETLDQVAYRLIRVGFPLMLFGIGTGLLLNDWRWNWDFQLTLVAATGLVYTLYLHARIAGWQGRRVNMMLLIACVCVLISFVAPGVVHR